MHLDQKTQQIPRYSECMVYKSAVWTLSQTTIKESDVWDKWSNLGSLLQVTILFEKQLLPCCLVLIEMEHLIRWRQRTRMLSDPPSPLTAIHSYSISTKALVWHMQGVRDKPQTKVGMNQLNEHVEIVLKGRPAVTSHTDLSRSRSPTQVPWAQASGFLAPIPASLNPSLNWHLCPFGWIHYEFNRGGKIIGLVSKWWH